MVIVYMCVVTRPGATKAVYASLKGVEEIVECHEVMGPYDIFAKIEVDGLHNVTALVTEVRNIEGIESTTTLVTFPE